MCGYSTSVIAQQNPASSRAAATAMIVRRFARCSSPPRAGAGGAGRSTRRAAADPFGQHRTPVGHARRAPAGDRRQRPVVGPGRDPDAVSRDLDADRARADRRDRRLRPLLHPRELASWLGITPSECSSGDQQHRGHITNEARASTRRSLAVLSTALLRRRAEVSADPFEPRETCAKERTRHSRSWPSRLPQRSISSSLERDQLEHDHGQRDALSLVARCITLGSG
jgi:Transposase IS116/IS110/IS902 family